MSRDDRDPDDASTATPDNDAPRAPVLVDEPGRRRFLATTALGAGAVGCALIAGPALVVIHDPIGRTTVETGAGLAPVGKVADFVVGQPTRVEIRALKRDAWSSPGEVVIGRAWVLRKPDDSFTVFSTVCPHLGCEVGLRTDDPNRFTCPCHESDFELDGAALGGPSPRGLDELEHEVDDEGVLSVRFQRFELNIPERVALEA